MNRPVPLLVNARAGALHEEPTSKGLQRMAADIGLDLQIVPVRSPHELQQRLRRYVAEKTERVAIAGGDGTVGLAVQELAHSDTALGILSQGTFNNFATALRLHHNIPAAMQTLATGVVKQVDLGKVANRYFTESAGVGLFADALALYGRGTNKNALRGLYTLFRLLFAFRPREVELILDGKSHRQRLALCEAANTYRIAQAAPIAPDADIEDGQLDVLVLEDIQRHELPEYFRALRAQMHMYLPKVTMVRARKIEIRSHGFRNVHCDDRVVAFTPTCITAEHHALKVLVDP